MLPVSAERQYLQVSAYDTQSGNCHLTQASELILVDIVFFSWTAEGPTHLNQVHEVNYKFTCCGEHLKVRVTKWIWSVWEITAGPEISVMVQLNKMWVVRWKFMERLWKTQLPNAESFKRANKRQWHYWWA